MDNLSLIVLTLIFSALFAGLEIAFISANKLKIEVDKNKGELSGRILSDLNRYPSRFIGAMLLGNNISLVIYGIVMSNLLEPVISSFLPEFMASHFWILIFQTIISTLVILVTAEFIPKAFFRINPNLILKVFSIPAYFFYYLFYPVIVVFTNLSETVIQSVFKVNVVQEEYSYTTVDLDNYIKEFSRASSLEGEVDPEFQIFQNAMEFKSVKLRECMVPRTEIVALEDNEPIEVFKELMIRTGHSKIIVFKESIDIITGYIHSFDLFKKPQSVTEVMRPIQIVPETMLASNALSLMIEQHKSVAVVVDEFGGTSGIVTMEDIIEEIFGEIRDEFDIDKLTDRQVNKNEFIFSGRLEIHYLNEKYKFNFPESEEYATLAGLIIHFHESIPTVNDEIVVDNFVFTILQASEKRIEQVHMKIKV